jgi:signal transduction histidine kinase
VILGVGLTAAVVLSAGRRRLRRRLELVARAEHELRGSATALGLALEALARDRPGCPEVLVVGSELGRLRVALEDLEAARMGRRAPPRVEPVEVGGLVRVAADAWGRPAERLGGRLLFDWRAGPALVPADARRIYQALSNVLANAVEHGGGWVDVVGTRVEGGVRVEVRDAGPGFWPVPSRSACATRGHGLDIARRAAREAGGELRVLPSPAGAAVAIDLPTGES